MDKKRAIVIDDETIVLESVNKILSQDGFDVLTASSGGAGISHAISEDFDIVITDIRMPDIDGFKVIRDIRKFKPGIPIVIITGYASVSSAVQAMKLGANQYLEKPFTPEQLMETVKNALATGSHGDIEEQTLIHAGEMKKVLEKGAGDVDFARNIFEFGADALDDFQLTPQEKLAIITADINWIEDQLGILPAAQKQWLTARKKA
jgi:DNA-binding NtrC family response regulator